VSPKLRHVLYQDNLSTQGDGQNYSNKVRAKPTAMIIEQMCRESEFSKLVTMLPMLHAAGGD